METYPLYGYVIKVTEGSKAPSCLQTPKDHIDCFSEITHLRTDQKNALSVSSCSLLIGVAWTSGVLTQAWEMDPLASMTLEPLQGEKSKTWSIGLRSDMVYTKWGACNKPAKAEIRSVAERMGSSKAHESLGLPDSTLSSHYLYLQVHSLPPAPACSKEN